MTSLLLLGVFSLTNVAHLHSRRLESSRQKHELMFFVLRLRVMAHIESFNPEMDLEKQNAAWERGTAGVTVNEFAL